MKREISNQEFEEALANPDVNGILNSISKKYIKSIEQDDLSTCKHVALWKALQYHDFNHPSKRKFTSSLYNFMWWECQRYQQNNRKNISNFDINSISEPSGSYNFTSVMVNDCLNTLSNEEQTLIRYKFFEKMTLKEISEKMNYSLQTVNVKLKRALDNFKVVYMKGEEEDG